MAVPSDFRNYTVHRLRGTRFDQNLTTSADQRLWVNKPSSGKIGVPHIIHCDNTRITGREGGRVRGGQSGDAELIVVVV